ncbi:Citrate lyase alpha chain [Budvicia aquatica]|uniref:Citrate lyase alpha chain n=1 Tax=Budvicia aquatica TaxID=82979 RepID=A0A484ZJ57_9GAMM|nr:Citrate lyase alpha chain [Budvicia aquatica]
MAINPRQVDTIHQAFSPTSADIHWAKRVVHALDEAKVLGSGVIALDGKMVDAPIVLRAERTLKLAAYLNLQTGGYGMKNRLNRELPDSLPEIGQLRPYNGAFAAIPDMRRCAPKVKYRFPGNKKLREDLESVFDEIPVTDGMTLSFHHHFRNGDSLVNQVLDIASRRGLKNLRIALSSVFPVHAPMVAHFKDGTVTYLDTDYMSGPVAAAVSQGF